jgi:hypothetical protein
MKSVNQEENQPITWDIFERNLLAWFRPTEYENFGEALSNITQDGTLRDYQKRNSRIWLAGWLDGPRMR